MRRQGEEWWGSLGGIVERGDEKEDETFSPEKTPNRELKDVMQLRLRVYKGVKGDFSGYAQWRSPTLDISGVYVALQPRLFL